ncbi:hypothetical protein Sgly_1081 [Syntrophobotulus glycolicus DSM 8271]|uniref:DZANK-type domain-containing protein n=1 Tax=Syntrophobotulus glycolicus (strain DSM 8271 / FlGlyR) TaxID=645991 RepID=F0SU24_SYNGF|nr:zinc ribbon domain-containing protein [Syntrophobotulus glycolicus]ADY55407.1 hypothetical protein Sgly_1081 [Syntrophobotulus glycolicus DSM 8271]
MSFFSRSSKGKHYKRGNQGSDHYQKKGFFGDLFKMIASRSGSGGHYNNHGNQYPNTPGQNQPVASAVICGKCNAQIPAGSKFCLECGEKVSESLFCTNCGEKLPANAKFCLKCGNKVNG